jgi:hypothetical protein
MEEINVRPVYEGGAVAASEVRPFDIEGIKDFTVYNTHDSVTLYVEIDRNPSKLLPIAPGSNIPFTVNSGEVWIGKMYVHTNGVGTGSFLVIKKVKA